MIEERKKIIFGMILFLSNSVFAADFTLNIQTDTDLVDGLPKSSLSEDDNGLVWSSVYHRKGGKIATAEELRQSLKEEKMDLIQYALIPASAEIKEQLLNGAAVNSINSATITVEASILSREKGKYDNGTVYELVRLLTRSVSKK